MKWLTSTWGMGVGTDTAWGGVGSAPLVDLFLAGVGVIDWRDLADMAAAGGHRPHMAAAATLAAQLLATHLVEWAHSHCHHRYIYLLCNSSPPPHPPPPPSFPRAVSLMGLPPSFTPIQIAGAIILLSLIEVGNQLLEVQRNCCCWSVLGRMGDLLISGSQ